MGSDEHSNQHSTATWIFALTTLSLFTIVLIVAPFLSAGAKHSISYEVVYWYELVLMVLAVIAMAVCAMCNGVECKCICRRENDESCVWAVLKAKYIEPVATVLCGLGSVVLPIFELLSISSCVGMENNRMYIIRAVSLGCIVLFSFVETVWLLVLHCSNYIIDVTKKRNAIALMFIILGNLVLCVRSIVDTVRASTTRAYENRNDTMHHHFFDVTLVFSKCSNNTEIADTGDILGVHRFAYSFPFQFGFLALKLIFSVLLNSENKKYTDKSNEEKHGTFYSCLDRYLPMLKKIVIETLLWLSNWSNVVSPVVVVLFLSTPYVILKVLSGALKNVDESSANDSELIMAMYLISLVSTYVYATVPICALFWLWKYGVKSELDFNKCLLMCCAVGNIFLCFFEIVDSFALVEHVTHKTYEVFYMISLVFRILGIYCQMIVIFDSHGFLEHETFVQNKQLSLHVRGVLIFLAYDNGVRWLVETFLPAPALKQVYQIKDDDLFGSRNWWLIVKLFTPFVLLFRLLASMMCFKLAAKMKHMYSEGESKRIQYDGRGNLLSEDQCDENYGTTNSVEIHNVCR